MFVILITVWPERYKQIVKKWRTLPSDQKAPFVSQARENRASIRMKKAQQVMSIFVICFIKIVWCFNI